MINKIENDRRHIHEFIRIIIIIKDGGANTPQFDIYIHKRRNVQQAIRDGQKSKTFHPVNAI